MCGFSVSRMVMWWKEVESWPIVIHLKSSDHAQIAVLLLLVAALSASPEE